MQRIKLVLEYDGTEFSGFQIQPNKRTVQAELEIALFKLFGKKIKIFACGRTDAGVHALCQVVHFDLKEQKIVNAKEQKIVNAKEQNVVNTKEQELTEEQKNTNLKKQELTDKNKDDATLTQIMQGVFNSKNLTQVDFKAINQKEFPSLMLMFELNKLLPRDISVIDAQRVALDFDARFSATEKTYILKFYKSRFERPLFANRQLRINDNIDVDAMKDGLKYIVGKQDFTSFVARKSGKNDFVRNIYSAEIVARGESQFEFRIRGNGFLYNMVRIIFGTLLMIGSHKILPSDIEKIIQSKNRAMSGKTVAPHGLYLAEVKYPR